MARALWVDQNSAFHRLKLSARSTTATCSSPSPDIARFIGARLWCDHSLCSRMGSICGHVRWCCRGDLWIPDLRSPRPLLEARGDLHLWICRLRSQSGEGCRLVNNLASLAAGIRRWVATPFLRPKCSSPARHRNRDAILVSSASGHKERSDETHFASGSHAPELRGVWNRNFRSGRSDYKSCTHHTAHPEHNDDHMPDQL
jgi:hypothetical protein